MTSVSSARHTTPEVSLTDNQDAMDYAAEYVLRTLRARIGFSRREVDQHAMAAARLAVSLWAKCYQDSVNVRDFLQPTRNIKA